MVRYLPAVIILLPWIAAIWISGKWLCGINNGDAGEISTARFTNIILFTVLALLLMLDILAVFQGTPGYIKFFPWIEIGSLRIMISFVVDRLSLTTATLIAVLGLFISKFAQFYLHREDEFQRFFAILNLLCGAMLLIVFAGNPLGIFIGWESAGLASFLLIAYANDRPSATDNAVRVFIIKRFGDTAFLFSIILSLLWFESLEWPDIFSPSLVRDSFQIGIVITGFLVAALAKSAQLPFAAWLGRALEGPTPSSAIFYGALLIHAGVFLTLRIEPLLQHSPGLQTFLIASGSLTALYSALCGLVQTDIKSAIIFSTQSQLGLIFVECGLGFPELALWHLIAHAIWRCYQLLAAPGYMQLLAGMPIKPFTDMAARYNWIYSAALQRFWLDKISDYLIVQPTFAIARDAHNFDIQTGGHFLKLLNIVEDNLQWVDNFLAQPHYLVLLIVATFIVVL